MENNVQDKWLIVYQGSLLDYNNDALKDSYKNKLVLVTGKKSSPNIDLVKSYLCVSDGTNDVKIPIPSLYFDTIKINGSEYGTKNNILEFAKANGIDISFDINTGAVTIDIKKDILDKIDSIDNKVEQTDYDDKVAELEGAIGGKYTKPAGGIPEKDLAFKVATEEGVNNAIRVVATDLNNKIDSKVGKTDLKDLKYTVNGTSSTYNGLSAANIPQIFAPTTIGSQGQLLQSMGGGAPQWTNLSAIKEAIGFAKDLTGVLEATPEEFTYRPSAGNKSIRDEGAVIRRIKGNTTVWGQYMKNSGLGAGDKYIAITQNNTEWTGTLQNMDSGCNNPWRLGIRVPTIKKVIGHKYLVVMDAMVSRLASASSNNSFSLEWGNEAFPMSKAMNTLTEWQTVPTIFSPNVASESTTCIVKPPWGFIYSNGGENGDYYKVKNAQLFDLTNIFGAGNEPQTYEDFKAIYPDIYPYCEPEIRNVKTTAIETVGFNQFDKSSAVVGILTSTGSIENTSSFSKNYFTARLNVLPNTTYYLLNVSNFHHTRSYVFYDAFGNVISSGGLQAPSSDYNASGTVTTPNDAAYMGVVVRDTFIDQCCINLSHTGVKNGEYEPYKKNTLLLPEIANYFSDGMNGIGDVYDEINSENAIQRWKSRPWQSGDDDNDDVITDGTTTIYKLSTPIITPILEPIQLVYDVEDFGTERAIAPENSAPFRADIVYQFNAEGRIRDNGRNIERLEKSTNILSSDVERLNGRFEDEFVIADGLLSSDDKYYYLPSFRSANQLYNLATEQYVINNIPTEIATATQLQKVDSLESLAIAPNIMYEYASGIGETGRVVFPARLIPPGSYDYTWMIRFPSIASSECLVFRDNSIRWKDGIPPTFTGGCALEIYIKEDANTPLGEWKIYR